MRRILGGLCPNRHASLIRALGVASLGAATIASAARSQVKILSDPGFLLGDTRDWSRASPLGDLRERPSSNDYRELRVWAGYGAFGTDGIVIRHEHGTWKAWLAVLVPCTLMIPASVHDSAHAATLRHYEHLARHRCGGAIGDSSRDTYDVQTDTLALHRLQVDSAAIARAWNDAIDAGIAQLPELAPRAQHGQMLDGLTYVTEMREGDEYRASEIEYRGDADSTALARVDRVFRAVAKLVQRKDELLRGLTAGHSVDP